MDEFALAAGRRLLTRSVNGASALRISCSNSRMVFKSFFAVDWKYSRPSAISNVRAALVPSNVASVVFGFVSVGSGAGSAVGVSVGSGSVSAFPKTSCVTNDIWSIVLAILAASSNRASRVSWSSASSWSGDDS